jgi:hypothetical protein
LSSAQTLRSPDWSRRRPLGCASVLSPDGARCTSESYWITLLFLAVVAQIADQNKNQLLGLRGRTDDDSTIGTRLAGPKPS